MFQASGTMQDNASSGSQDLNQSGRRARRGPRFTLGSGAKPLDGYTIKRGVGVGGFGEVYYATSDAGKEVALKRIQRNLDIELRGVRHCLNIKHQNLVALFDIKFDAEEQAWVVMEYVSGESLQDVIERNPQGMPLDQIKKWFGGIAAGVAHLHDCGIVHRDLKPGNIFIDRGTVKIGDYGLSKFISCSRRSGQTQSVGTFHYMAPEIGQGTYGKEIDVYALGIILYEMVTGRVPFDGESSQEIIMKHLTAQPDLNGIQSPFREVLRDALAKDPANRISDAADMMKRIEGVATASDVARKVADTARSAGNAAGHYAGIAGAQFNATAPKVADAAKYAASHVAANVHTVANVAVQNVRTTDATRIPPEPVAALVSKVYYDAIDAHKGLTAHMSPAQARVLHLFMVIGYAILGLMAVRFLGPLPFMLLFFYGIYYVGRWALLSLFGTGSSATPSPANEVYLATEVAMQTDDQPVLAEPVVKFESPDKRRAAKKAAAKNRRADKRRENPVAVQQRILRTSLKTKTSRSHLTELTGSYLVAGLVCAIVAFLGFIISSMADGTQYRWIGTFTWIAISSTLAAWSVLFTSKWWESSKGDAILRRFVMFGSGLFVGAASWLTAVGMNLQPRYSGFGKEFIDEMEPLGLENLPSPLYNELSQPLPLAFLAFFGCLFVALRWWKQADPIRSSRFGIWRTGLVLVGALIVQLFFPFPGGLAIAASTAIAVQMAAPFIDRENRDLICKAAVEDIEQGEVV